MRKYTLIDGYPAARGYIIKQDHNGFIWIGSENGAVRFDGKKFQVLRDEYQPADQEILSCDPYGSDQVLFVPLLNNIAYYQGGTVFSGRKDARLHSIRNKGKNVVFFDAYTRNIWLFDENRLGTAHCFSAQGIARVDIPEQEFSLVSIRHNQAIGFDGQRKMCRYDLLLKRFLPLYDTAHRDIRAGYAQTTEDGRHLLLCDSTGKELLLYVFCNDSTLQLVKNIRPSLRNWNAFADAQLRVWLRLLDGGIAYLQERENHAVRSFRFLDSTVINCLFADQAGNIWMSAQNNSLYFLSEKHFRNALRVDNVLPDKNIPRCIAGDSSGNICIGYINKPRLALLKNGKCHYFPLSADFWEGVRHILSLGGNRFLVQDKALALVDGNRNKIRYFNLPPIAYKDMYLCRDGGLLVANQSNIFYLDPQAVASAHCASSPLVIFKGRTSAVAEMQDGTILVGTPDGLFIQKERTAAPERVDHPILSHINITDIADNGKDGALISTNAQGLYYYNSRTGKVQVPGNQPEISTGLVRRIFKQDDDTYWLATEKGACEVLFDAGFKVKQVRSYTFYDGLPSNNVTGVYVYRDTAYVTTAEGAGIIPLKDTSLQQMAPPRVFINNVQLHKTQLYQPTGPLNLTHGQNDFLISLSAISYESFGNVKYHYKLEGLNEEWITTDNPEIRFAGLAPGNYRFSAYASNAKGTMSDTPVALAIRILPAFWQTLTFQAAVFVLAALALYLFLRRRALQAALDKYEKARQERRLAELELEAIKAQINPHFIYNCLNSIQYFNFERKYDQAKQYLDLFARLIRLTMQYSQQAFISIEEEIDYLGNYLQLEQLRFRDRLRYEVLVTNEIDKHTLIPAMLLQPYVENALKHGIAARRDGGKVSIRFALQEKMLMICIEDDGPGFGTVSGNNKRSLGLRLSGSRAEAYNQLFSMNIEIYFYDKKSYDPEKSGIIVQLKIPPVSHEHVQL